MELAVGNHLWSWLLGTICGTGCWEPSSELAVGNCLWNWLLGTIADTANIDTQCRNCELFGNSRQLRAVEILLPVHACS